MRMTNIERQEEDGVVQASTNADKTHAIIETLYAEGMQHSVTKSWLTKLCEEQTSQT